MFPHVVAAAALGRKQKPARPGDLVDYVYLNSEQVNPMKRVAPAESAGSCNIEKCAEMLLDVTEVILGVFGFSRSRLGFERKPRSFLDELRGKRGR